MAAARSRSHHSCPPGGSAALLEHEVEGLGYGPLGSVRGLGPAAAASAALRDVALTSVLCNDAALFYKEGAFQRTGEPTEAALKVWRCWRCPPTPTASRRCRCSGKAAPLCLTARAFPPYFLLSSGLGMKIWHQRAMGLESTPPADARYSSLLQ